MANSDPLYYPSWSYNENPNDPSVDQTSVDKDKEIWQKLCDYVGKRQGPKNTVAKRLLTDLLIHEMGKENFIYHQQYMKKSSKDKRQATFGGQVKVVDPENAPATKNILFKNVAPFPVPKDPNDKFPIKEGSYYNFRIRGRTFNGKVTSDNTDPVVFDKNTITMQIATGNYQRKVNGCDIFDLKDKDGEKPFDLNGDDLRVPRKDIDVVENEVLRPYLKFLRFVDEAFNLPDQSVDCNSDERMIMLLDHLRKLLIDSKLDITGHPWRRVEANYKYDNETKKILDKNPYEKEPPKKKSKTLSFPDYDSDTGRRRDYKEDDKITVAGKTYILKDARNQSDPTAGPSGWVQITNGTEPYSLLDIDKQRIEVDALLWTREHTEPSVYDLFEVLRIPKSVTLEMALNDTITILEDRKDSRINTPHEWEPSIYTFYGNKRNRTRKDIWESALVNCLRSTKTDSYVRAIVDHIFLNPMLQNGKTPYTLLNNEGEMKSKAFESFDGELAQNFATHLRAGQDSAKFLMILKLPWPETKKHLRKQPERNRYYPEAFVQARYPDIFYLNLQAEHDACDRLRRTAHALSLSRERGMPVIQRPQVVAPDAFHTDYETLPLPKIVSADANGTYKGPSKGREYWDGADPNFVQEYGREAYRSGKTPRIYTEPISRHPLYPSSIKANFDS